MLSNESLDSSCPLSESIVKHFRDSFFIVKRFSFVNWNIYLYWAVDVVLQLRHQSKMEKTSISFRRINLNESSNEIYLSPFTTRRKSGEKLKFGFCAAAECKRCDNDKSAKFTRTRGTFARAFKLLRKKGLCRDKTMMAKEVNNLPKLSLCSSLSFDAAQTNLYV